MDFDFLYKPFHLKELCAQYGFSPSKRYGQHFLISPAPVAKMMKAADLKNTDTIVEIGPGFGSLTLPVSEKVERVYAFEIEQRLKPYWEGLTEKHKNIHIIWGNALNALPVFPDIETRPYKVLANLPYQITSQTFRTLFELKNLPRLVACMVQKEVAERICAKAGDMSILSVSVQYFGHPQVIAQVPRGAFWPQPKVDSSIILITDIHRNQNNEAFFNLIRAAFSNKRKQAWRNICTVLNIPQERVKGELFEVAGNEKIRAQELSLAQWKDLFQRLD
ncbi:MAG: ribosomal RNA small subunit methyltransferase A [Candidatus Magasanikbacteria bacterium]|nr:ribosomal RNA small subunit methyltransferase A [Candidatus Magasanikbacteria bacterium]